jgi:hypothetical protein
LICVFEIVEANGAHVLNMELTEDNYSEIIPRRRSRNFIIIGVIAFVLLFPYKTTIVPEWKLRAVNKNGEPLPHTGFRQSWDNYSYDIHGMEFREGDDNGYVVLPERAFYAPLIYRILRSALAYLMLFAHGSIGNDASLNALTDKCSSEHLNYEQIKTLPETIVISCADTSLEK